MRVTTDSKHYENMAAKIREKTGTSATYKPSEMPSGVDAVYKAGQSSMVDESKLIPKTVSGSYISVDDVSEIPHSVGCKVESVNLFKNPTLAANGTSNGITWTVNEDKSVTLNGKSTATAIMWYVQQNMPAGTYTLSGVPTGAKAVYIQVNKVVDGVEKSVVSGSLAKSFELTDENTFIKVFIAVYPNYTLDNVTIYPMLNRGTEALPYTPYVKPEEVKVTRTGKKLATAQQVWSGCEEYSEVVEDGRNSIRFLTSVDAKNELPVFEENTQYTFSFDVKAVLRNTSYAGNTDLILRVLYTDGTNTSIYFNPNSNEESAWEKRTLTTTEGKTIQSVGSASYAYYHWIYIDVDTFQVEKGAIATAYEPYNGQTFTPSTDGTVEGMTSVSPYMNVFSDTEGVNIEATYNKSWGMQTEYDRFWDTFQNYGKRDNYYVAFFAGSLASSCWNNDNFKPKYPIKPVNAQNMFANINIEGDLTQSADIDFSNATNVAGSINYCPRITRIGVVDLRKVSTNGLSLVSNCSKLETIDEIIFKNDGSQYSTAGGMVFTGCTALKNLIITGKINFNFNTQPCPLTKTSITSVINALYEGSTDCTATFKLSAVNTAFETSAGAGDGSTSAEFAALVATKTNWTITMI